jgi:DNA repair protein RadC
VCYGVCMHKTYIRNLEKIEQPREKLLKYGVDKLTDAEILAIVLRTGKQGRNVVEVAKKILREFAGTQLAQASVAELMRMDGVGQVKALEVVACFELGRRLLKDKQVELVLNARQVWDKMEDVRASKKEHFVMFFMNTQNELIQRELISVGTLNASLIHPREVFEPAIRHVASHIIVAHNHPSGGLEPSSEDLVVTRRLREAGILLGIQLVDHVIVTATAHHSLKEHNEL